jgi:DNA-directed RNA polymerase subunit RPC12/RpoP
MPIDVAAANRPPPPYALDRRQRRAPLPDCPSCGTPLVVDVRSTDTLYARCQWCGHRRMVAKPAAPADV